MNPTLTEYGNSLTLCESLQRQLHSNEKYSGFRVLRLVCPYYAITIDEINEIHQLLQSERFSVAELCLVSVIADSLTLTQTISLAENSDILHRLILDELGLTAEISSQLELILSRGTLEHLSLQNCVFHSSSDVSRLLRSIPFSNTLHSLSISMIDDLTLEELLLHSSRLNLKQLHVEGLFSGNITSREYTFASLEELSLINCNLTTESFEYLARTLAECSDLSHLDVSQNSLADSVIETLGLLENLSYLVLSETLITDIGIDALAEIILARGIELHELWIEYVFIQDSGWNAVQRIMSARSIHKLNVSSQLVTFQDRNEWQSAMTAALARSWIFEASIQAQFEGDETVFIPLTREEKDLRWGDYCESQRVAFFMGALGRNTESSVCSLLKNKYLDLMCVDLVFQMADMPQTRRGDEKRRKLAFNAM